MLRITGDLNFKHVYLLFISERCKSEHFTKTSETEQRQYEHRMYPETITGTLHLQKLWQQRSATACKQFLVAIERLLCTCCGFCHYSSATSSSSPCFYLQRFSQGSRSGLIAAWSFSTFLLYLSLCALGPAERPRAST